MTSASSATPKSRGLFPRTKLPNSSSIRKATIFHVSFSLESQNSPEAWLKLGFTDSCDDPSEVVSLFSSGVDSPFFGG